MGKKHKKAGTSTASDGTASALGVAEGDAGSASRPKMKRKEYEKADASPAG